MVKKRSTFLTLTSNSSELKGLITFYKSSTSFILNSLKFIATSKYFSFSYNLKYLTTLLSFFRFNLIVSNYKNLSLVYLPFFKKSRFFKNSFSNSFYLDKNSNTKLSNHFSLVESAYIPTTTKKCNLTYDNTLLDATSSIYRDKIYDETLPLKLDIAQLITIKRVNKLYSLHKVLNLVWHISMKAN